MRLTLHADYSLRVLMYVGMKGGALSTIDEIGRHFDIPRNHLTKVVQHLGQSGYLETIRGKNGGVRLMRKPSQINIGAVIRDTEEELRLLGYLQGEDYCRIQSLCILRLAVKDATVAFFSVLDQYTLDDLIRPGRALARLLKLTPLPAKEQRSGVA
jgi:Rrf2 family nitric oxide-sensitive transcriptional repressor